MGQFKRVSVQEASKLIEQGAQLIDIRDEPSFVQGHIRGASRFDRQALFELAEEGQPQDTYLLYCYKGNSSQMAAQMLADEGFENVFSMDGGFTQWHETFPDQIES
jgi:thiosulfate sulfurtransferase